MFGGVEVRPWKQCSHPVTHSQNNIRTVADLERIAGANLDVQEEKYLDNRSICMVCLRHKTRSPLTQSSEDVRTCKLPIEIDSVVLRVEHPTHPDEDDLQRAWRRETDD